MSLALYLTHLAWSVGVLAPVALPSPPNRHYRQLPQLCIPTAAVPFQCRVHHLTQQRRGPFALLLSHLVHQHVAVLIEQQLTVELLPVA